MLKYNFPYSTPNGDSAVVLNFLMPGSYMGNIDDDPNQSNDDLNKIKAELNQVKNALCTVQKELERCKNNPNKCNKEEFDRVTAKLKECQNEIKDTASKLKTCMNNKDTAEAALQACKDGANNKETESKLKTCEADKKKAEAAEKTCKDALDKCKNDSNKCDKEEFDKVKAERDKCKNDPDKCNKADLDRVTAERDKCQNDPNKCNKEELDRVTAEHDKCKSDLSECNKGKVVNPVTDNTGVVKSKEITEDHLDNEMCGEMSDNYIGDELIGNKGFNTSDLIESLHPKMYGNAEIEEHIKDGTYGPVNYVFALTSSNILHTVAIPSNMSCKKCEDETEHFACTSGEFKSFCYAPDPHTSATHSKNLLTNKVCPNLVSKSKEMPNDIKAKQISPLILVNESGEMIGKDGKNTGVKYEDLKLCLLNGRIKDNTECKKFAETMQQVGWDTDKTVQLKTSTSTYSYDNQDIHLFADTNLI